MHRIVLFLVLLIAWVVASPAAAQECEATGTLAHEPARPVAGEKVRMVATVDSPDAACRDLVRSEPFVIITGAVNGELSLVPEGDQFTGAFESPGGRWTATLYVVGTGNALAAFEIDPSASLTDLSFWYARSPGAVTAIGAAIVLGLLAVIGQSADYGRAPRWLIRLRQASRRFVARGFQVARNRFGRARVV